MAMARADVIYDGQCTFCIRSLHAIKRFDAAGRLRLVDGSDRASMARRYPGLDIGGLDTAMYTACEGRYERGYDAFVRIFLVVPELRPLGYLMRVRPVSSIGQRIYALVARNRRTFGCASGICAIPENKNYS